MYITREEAIIIYRRKKGMYSQEVIDQAALADLVNYCEGAGIKLRREGAEYVVVDHPSIYISAVRPYMWYRFSSNEGGKAIDFCVKYLGLDFKSAVDSLLRGAPAGYTAPARIDPVQRREYQFTAGKDCKRVIGYLCKRRGLSYDLVVDLIRQGKLRQDQRGNCVFPIYDVDGQVIGAELRGCGDQKFHQISSSQDGYGYTVQCGREVKWVVFTEGAVDALSLYQMYKPRLQNVLVVSMGGLKPAVVQRYRELYPSARFCLAVDIDPRRMSSVGVSLICPGAGLNRAIKTGMSSW